MLKKKIKQIPKKKEEENLYKKHKIETKKEIGEKRNIKEITKKGYNKY